MFLRGYGMLDLLRRIMRWVLWSPADWLHGLLSREMPSLPVDWVFFVTIFTLVVASLWLPVPNLSPIIPPKAFHCVFSLLILWGALRWKRLGLQSIGLSQRDWRREASIGLGVFLIIATGLVVFFSIMGAPPRLKGWPTAFNLTYVTAYLTWLFTVVLQAVAVAISEEAIFRGWLTTFLLTRLSWRDGAALISAVIFGLTHFDKGLGDVVFTALLGYLLALLYIWRKNLTAAIAVHALHNFAFWLGLLGGTR